MRAVPPPLPAYLRPQLVHQHDLLFKEPAYPDGQPYANDDDLEDDESA